MLFDYFSFLALRYIQCIHTKLYHLSVADYEEFTNTILSCRAAFQITLEGNNQFKDWIQSIRRYVCLFMNTNSTNDFIYPPISCGFVYKFLISSFHFLFDLHYIKQIKVLQERVVAADSVGHAKPNEMTEN